MIHNSKEKANKQKDNATVFPPSVVGAVNLTQMIDIQHQAVFWKGTCAPLNGTSGSCRWHGFA